MKYPILIPFFLLPFFLMAQSEHSVLLDGTIAYQKGDFETAGQSFLKAVEKNNASLKGNFNLGNSLYKRQKYDEAATYYQNAASNTENKTQKAQALYNLGNTRLAQAKNNMQQQGQGPAMLNEEGQKQLGDAIDAYKNALRNNTQDYDAKNNLASAYKLLRQQQQQQQQNKDQNKDNKDQNNDDNQDQKDDQNKDQDQKDNQDQKDDQDSKPKDNKPIDNNNNPADDNGEAKELTKDEVDRLLEIIEQDDKKVQEKLMARKRSKSKKPEKAW